MMPNKIMFKEEFAVAHIDEEKAPRLKKRLSKQICLKFGTVVNLDCARGGLLPQQRQA